MSPQSVHFALLMRHGITKLILCVADLTWSYQYSQMDCNYNNYMARIHFQDLGFNLYNTRNNTKKHKLYKLMNTSSSHKKTVHT